MTPHEIQGIEDKWMSVHPIEERPSNLHHLGDDTDEDSIVDDAKVQHQDQVADDEQHQDHLGDDCYLPWPWPCPILECYLASGIAEDQKAIARRLLDHPKMAEAWKWASARYTSPRPLFLVLKANLNQTLRYYCRGKHTLQLTTPKDEASPLEAIARTAQDLQIQIRQLPAPWLDGYAHDPDHPEANPSHRLAALLGDLAREATAMANYFTATHPSPRTFDPSLHTRDRLPRHPRRKTLNRLLARAFYRGDPYTSTERRLIGILTEAGLGPDLDCPPPVTGRMVKEDLRNVNLAEDDSVLFNLTWYKGI